MWNDEETIVKNEIDLAEIYRQDYMDARDMVHDLEYENAQLRAQIEILQNQLDKYAEQ